MVHQEKVSVRTNIVFLLREAVSVKGNNHGEGFPGELRTQQEMRRKMWGEEVRRQGEAETSPGGWKAQHGAAPSSLLLDGDMLNGPVHMGGGGGGG